MGALDQVSFSTDLEQANQPQRLTLENTSSTTLQNEIMVAQPNQPAEPKSSTIGQMKDAFLHTSIQGPINGVTQIIDGIAGTNLKEKAQWFDAPQEASFGSFDWHMQQIGNAGGIAADFLALAIGMKGGARLLARAGLVRAIPGAQTALSSFVSRPIVNAAVTGAVYDGVFRESAQGESLLSSRLLQVGTGALTFGGLAATSRGLQAVAKSGVFGQTASNLIGSRVGSSFLAGIPAGAGNAVLLNGSNTTWQDVYQGGYTYAFSGGVMGGANAIGAKMSAWREARNATAQADHTPPPDKTHTFTVPGIKNGVVWQAEIPATMHSGTFHADAGLIQTGPWQKLKANLSNSVGVEAISAPHVSFTFGPQFGLFSKIRNRWQPTPPPEEGVTLFLDGGGVNGWRHIGVIKALEEARIKVGAVYGVSIGTIVASLLAKGKSSAEIESVFFREFHNPLVQETLPKEAGLAAFWRRTDATPMVSHWVNEYGLRPIGSGEGTPSLHIGTFYARQRRLHWFEGTDYDMVPAMKSSMGIPGVFSNLKIPREMLGLGKGNPVTMLDGGIRNVTAQDLPKDRPVIISRLHNADVKAENRAVNSKFLAWLERATSKVLHRNLGAPDGEAVVIHPKQHELNSLAFDQPDSVYRNLMQDGYQQAKLVIDAAIRDGKITQMPEPGTYQTSARGNQILAPALEWLKSLRPQTLQDTNPPTVFTPVPARSNDK